VTQYWRDLTTFFKVVKSLTPPNFPLTTIHYQLKKMADQNYYPPVSFLFKVEFEGIPDLKDRDAYFQEVSGLSQEFEFEENKQGGDNSNPDKVPKGVKYPSLVLKRGVFKDSGVLKWIMDAMDEPLSVKPCSVIVKLLNENQEPLMTFNFEQVIPMKWSLDGFNAQESKIAVETIELHYKKFKLIL
jgi:phage tail-like protein